MQRNSSEPVEICVASECPEEFDVEDAISRVKELARAQIATQSRRLHQFRPEWIEQLETRYRNLPGNPLIHLSDLPGKTAIQLSEKGLGILGELWKRIKQTYRVREVRKLGLENIYSCAVARYYPYIVLESLRRADASVGFNMNQLECHVIRLKCHKNNWPKEIEPNLPFDFRNEKGAAILAYYTDSKHATGAFTNKNPELHELVKGAVEGVVGRMRVNTKVHEDANETYWSLLLPTLLTIAGIDTKQRQKVANNPAPPWVFLMPDNVVSAYLRALWTAEGMARFMRLVQAVTVPLLEPYRDLIASKPSVTPYNSLPTEAREIISLHPSLLLASAALLQRSLGLDATIKPSVAYSDFRNELSVLWTIEITSAAEILKFSKLVGFDSESKEVSLTGRIRSLVSQPALRPEPFEKGRTSPV